MRKKKGRVREREEDMRVQREACEKADHEDGKGME